MEEQIELLRIEFEKEYGMYWWINKTGTAERSLPYQEWLEKKAIQVQAKVKPACDEQILQAKIDENEYWLKFLNADASNIVHKSSLINRVKFLENENRKSI